MRIPATINSTCKSDMESPFRASGFVETLAFWVYSAHGAGSPVANGSSEA